MVCKMDSIYLQIKWKNAKGQHKLNGLLLNAKQCQNHVMQNQSNWETPDPVSR